MRMSISLFTVFLLTALLIGVEGWIVDPEGYNTRWASQTVYDTHVREHASQHKGVDNYLQEVRDAMVQEKAQPRDIVTGHQFTSNGRRATITYLGGEDNNAKYRVTVGGTPRCLVVTDNGPTVVQINRTLLRFVHLRDVVTYHKAQRC